MAEIVEQDHSDHMVVWSAYGVRMGETWFGKAQSDAMPEGVDVAMLYNFKEPLPQATETHTILIDLNQRDEELMGHFKQETRYKIRRANDKDGLEFNAFNPAAIQNDGGLLTEFMAFYNAFARQKGQPALNREHLEMQSASGVLWLSCARRSGQILVWHAHIANRNKVRLRNSASHYRGEDSAMSNMIGRANRWLHWRDMQTFREAGMCTYDFGGWYAGDSDEERLKINRFKEGFGGETVKEYNCVIPISYKGLVFLPAKSAYNWLKNRHIMTWISRLRA